MLQLRCSETFPRTDCRIASTYPALQWGRRVPQGQQSMVGFRISTVSLQARRGDAVAAFLATSKTQKAGALPGPPPSAVSHQLLVYTTEGVKAIVTVLPGVTTVGQLRAQVAEIKAADPAQVRLSYAGKERPPSLDGSLLALKPGIDVLAALQRFQGGAAAAAAPTAAAAADTGHTLADAAAAPAAAAAAAAAGATEPRRLRRRHPAAVAERESKLVWAASSADVVPDRRHVAAQQVPGSTQGCSAELQLARQFRDLLKNPIPGISAAPSDDDLFVWNVQLAGPAGTPYEGGWFSVQLEFTCDFPGDQPMARFVTPIWHPNICELNGDVCMYLGSDSGQDVCSITCVLVGLQILLASPNPCDPINEECADQMWHDPRQFEAQARCWTRKHAM